jgi:inhibitor of KinA
MTGWQIGPLGDQAALVATDTEQEATCLADQVRRSDWPWLVDVVQAYSSVAVFYDPDSIRFSAVQEELQNVERGAAVNIAPGRCHVVPCCYAMELDLDRVCAGTGLDRQQVIEAHCGTQYTVYAIGFCPGFPYLGYLPAQLCGIPRLASPRLRVEPGSVGLTGRQTGIYTLPRPGGWSLIGRTPLQLVDVADGYFPLRTGDQVRFEPIDRTAYGRLDGKRLG